MSIQHFIIVALCLCETDQTHRGATATPIPLSLTALLAQCMPWARPSLHTTIKALMERQRRRRRKRRKIGKSTRRKKIRWDTAGSYFFQQSNRKSEVIVEVLALNHFLPLVLHMRHLSTCFCMADLHTNTKNVRLSLSSLSPRRRTHQRIRCFVKSIEST